MFSMITADDIRIAQALIQAAITARRNAEGDNDQVRAEQARADAICANLEAMIGDVPPTD